MAASTEGFNLGAEKVRRGDGLELEAARQCDLYRSAKRVGIPAVGEPKNRRVERHHVPHKLAVLQSAERRTLPAVLRSQAPGAYRRLLEDFTAEKYHREHNLNLWQSQMM